jgi:AraC-like DNA-binding protein
MNLFGENRSRQKYSIRLWILIGSIMLSAVANGWGNQLNAQEESSSEEDIFTNGIQLSHIEIQEQFIDYRKLKDPTYREEITFGEALSKAFDSTVAHYNYPVTMRLPYFLNTLTFHFAAIDWKAPHKIEYSYYLKGLEDDWGKPAGRPNVIYRNLPYGTYELHVRAIGASRTWSEPFTYTFTIQHPWWRTWWAYSAYALVLASAGFALVLLWLQRRKEVEEMQQLLAAHKERAFSVVGDRESISDVGGFLGMVNHTLELHLSDENFGIAELCEILNISRAQLHRKLKKLTGQSTSHYIRSLRLDIAKDMLSDSNLHVAEVAFSVGFSSAAYFSKVFKAQFGYSPSELR